MGTMSNILSKTGAGALMVGAMVALAPVGAAALTIGLYDASTGTSLTITDGGLGDQSSAVGVVSTSGVTVGEAFVAFQLALFTDATGVSSLQLLASATAGSDVLFIDALHTGFVEGINAPDPTSVTFKMNASSISGSILGAGYVDTGNTGGLFFDPPGAIVGAQGSLAGTADNISEAGAFVLSNPFALTIQTDLAGGSSVQFDATLLAAIPLPAGGLLLLTALGGVAALRRRRKAA